MRESLVSETNASCMSTGFSSQRCAYRRRHGRQPHFERLRGDQTLIGTVSPRVAALDDVWRRRGIQRKCGKDVDRQLTGDALGLTLFRGTMLLPKRARLVDILSSIHTLCAGLPTSPRAFSHFCRGEPPDALSVP